MESFVLINYYNKKMYLYDIYSRLYFHDVKNLPSHVKARFVQIPVCVHLIVGLPFSRYPGVQANVIVPSKKWPVSCCTMVFT